MNRTIRKTRDDDWARWRRRTRDDDVLRYLSQRSWTGSVEMQQGWQVATWAHRTE